MTEFGEAKVALLVKMQSSLALLSARFLLRIQASYNGQTLGQVNDKADFGPKFYLVNGRANEGEKHKSAQCNLDTLNTGPLGECCYHPCH